MPRIKPAARRMPNNNFNNRRFATARAAMNNRNKGRRTNFNIKFLLPQGKDVKVKHCRRVESRIRVRRKTIFRAAVRER